MTQKAEHHISQDYYDSKGRSEHQNRWIWGSLAALAALVCIVWYATQGGLRTSPAPTAAVTQEEPATSPVVPAEPAAPAVGNQTDAPAQ